MHIDDSPLPSAGAQESSIHYDERAIEALLDRSQEGEEERVNLLANEYLSSFKVGSPHK